jgi:hypothetical protein
MLFGGVVYFHGWVKPAMRELRHQVNTLSRERRILMYKIEFMEELRALEDTLRMRRKGMYTVSNLHMLFFSFFFVSNISAHILQDSRSLRNS